MKKCLIIPVLGCLFTLVSCGSPNQQLIEDAPYISVHFQDDLGRDISLKSTPKRIVSLSPGVTETLFALGAGDRMVARSIICDFPEDALDLPEIESYPMIDLKAIAELKPDLVITSSDVHSEDITRYFDGLKFPLYYQKANSLTDLYAGIESLGKVVSEENRAKTLVDSLQLIESKIIKATEGQIKYATMIVAQVDSEVVVAGGRGFLNDLLTKAGGKNIFGDKDKVYAEVTAEDILNKAPEYILLASSDEQMYAAMMAKYPVLHLNLPASQNNHVFQVQPELTRRPTPRIMEGLAQMTRTLHSRINVTEFFDAPSQSEEQPEAE